MTVDPQVQMLLEKAAALGLPSFEEVGHLRARAGYENQPPSGLPAEVARVEDRRIPGPDGDELGLRLYWPDGDGPHPVLVDGVDVRLIRYPGQVHGFFGMTRFLDQAREAQDSVAAALRRAWA